MATIKHLNHDPPLPFVAAELFYHSQNILVQASLRVDARACGNEIVGVLNAVGYGFELKLVQDGYFV